MINPPLWKASVALTKAQAADLAAALELGSDPQAVLISEEPFSDYALVEALYSEEPDDAYLARISCHKLEVTPVADQDWVRLSHEGLPPVRAGRFFLFGAHDLGVVPHGVVPIRIEAGLAFGTGHHESTALCLSLLCEMAQKRHFRKILDLGCGTGVLGIAAAKLLKRHVWACDIDPVAVAITKENAKLNQVGALVKAVPADGLANPILTKAGPYDLLLANILASPLTRLSREVCACLAEGAIVILSGILCNQEDLVLSFYRKLRLVKRERMGPWSALVLEKPKR